MDDAPEHDPHDDMLASAAEQERDGFDEPSVVQVVQPVVEPVVEPTAESVAGSVAGSAAAPAATADAAEPSLDLDAIAADLADVEVALARLDAGTYWTDEVTGQPLPDELLEAHPTARRSPA